MQDKVDQRFTLKLEILKLIFYDWHNNFQFF